jgi:RimJ/RimL family protein N-acetyltransferase
MQQLGQQGLGLFGGLISLAVSAPTHLVCETADGGPVGVVALTDVSWRNRSAFVGAYVAAPHRSDDLMKLVYRRAIAYCFDELNLHRVGVYVETDDPIIPEVCERFGGRREAVLRGHVLREGQATDLYAYGILRSEYDGVCSTSASGNGRGA